MGAPAERNKHHHSDPKNMLAGARFVAPRSPDGWCRPPSWARPEPALARLAGPGAVVSWPALLPGWFTTRGPGNESGTPASPRLRVRRRRGEDLDRFLPMAEKIKALDSYPEGVRSAERRELRTFLEARGALGSWVAVPTVTGKRHEGEAYAPLDGQWDEVTAPVGLECIAGHVVLGPARHRGVAELAQRGTGLPLGGLAVIARLVVSPCWRRRGVGRLLLRTAAEEARRRDLHPVLDTW